MGYVVVVCDRCRQARGVEVGKESVTCLRCGKRHKLRRLQIYASVEDKRDLPDAVGRVSAKVNQGSEQYVEDVERYGNKDEPIPCAGPEAIARSVKGLSDKRSRARLALQELSRDGPFTLDDAKRVFELAGIGEAETYMQLLLESGELFEPIPGKYQIV